MIIQILSSIATFILVFINFYNIKNFNRNNIMDIEKQYTIATLRNILKFIQKVPSFIDNWKYELKENPKYYRNLSHHLVEFSISTDKEFLDLKDTIEIDLHFVNQTTKDCYLDLIVNLKSIFSDDINTRLKNSGQENLSKKQEYFPKASITDIKIFVEKELKSVISNNNFSFREYLK